MRRAARLAVSLASFHICPLWRFWQGYMLRACHEAAPAEFWEEVVYLQPKQMWRSLFLQCYDESARVYSTFQEAIDRHTAQAKAKAA